MVCALKHLLALLVMVITLVNLFIRHVLVHLVPRQQHVNLQKAQSQLLVLLNTMQHITARLHVLLHLIIGLLHA